MRSHLRTILFVGLAAGLLALFLRSATNLAAVWKEIENGDPRLLLLGFVSTTLNYVLRSYRWQFLLRPIGRTRFSEALKATVIGFAVNSLLPARAGEVIRPYLLARREGLSATSAFATILVERLLDLVTVLVFFGIFLLVFDPRTVGDSATFRAVKIGGLTAAGGALLALAFVFVLAGHPDKIPAFTRRLERWLPLRLVAKIGHLLQMFAEGFAVVRQPARLAQAVVLSIPLWVSISLGIWAVTRAFHIDIPYTGSFAVMTILVVGVAVPTPGSIGGFHAAYQIAVTAFYGVNPDRAVGAALILHAISFVPVTIAGIGLMIQEGLSLGRMRGLATLARAEEGRG